MWSFAWRNPVNFKRIYSTQSWRMFKTAEGDEEILITDSYAATFGVFNAVVLSSATTTTIATPAPNGSLVVTDLVVSAKKVAATTIDIEFDDGTDTEIILSPDTVNQAPNFAWAPVGRVQGWRDAALKVVTTGGNTDATVTAGYIKIPNGLVFADWDALR